MLKHSSTCTQSQVSGGDTSFAKLPSLYYQVKEGPAPPSPLNGQVTVAVKACGLNFYDIYVQQGLSPEIQPPCTLGLECAGVISAVGEDVESVKVCWGWINGSWNNG